MDEQKLCTACGQPMEAGMEGDMHPECAAKQTEGGEGAAM